MSAPDDAPADPVAPSVHAATAASSSMEEPALLIWCVALLAVLAALSARAVEPALPGVWIGIDHLITAVKLAAALASQLFAVVSAAVVIGLLLGTVRATSLPAYFRAYAVGAGVLVIIAVMIASARALPEAVTLVMAVTISALGIMSAWLSARFINLRGAALLLGVMAVGGVVRVAAILLAELTRASGSSVALVAARVAATLATGMEGIGLIIAAVWYVRRSRAERARGRWPRWPSLVAALVAAAALVFVATKGLVADVAGAHVFVARALAELIRQPEPYVPWLLRASLEASRWSVILATLLLCPRTRLMSAVVAFGLTAGVALEVPLGGMCLTIGALSLALHPGPDLREELAPQPST